MRLAKGETTVMELARPFKMSQPAVSRHLKVLEQAGLISTTVRGQERPRRLETKPLKEATAWIEKYRQMWEKRYQALDGLLEELQNLQTQGVSTEQHRVGQHLDTSHIKGGQKK